MQSGWMVTVESGGQVTTVEMVDGCAGGEWLLVQSGWMVTVESGGQVTTVEMVDGCAGGWVSG